MKRRGMLRIAPKQQGSALLILLFARLQLTVGKGRTSWFEFAGRDCHGTGEDPVRGWPGTTQDCKSKCRELQEVGQNCAGFERIHGGSGLTGQCFFRAGPIQPPRLNRNRDVRSCYVPFVPLRRNGGLLPKNSTLEEARTGKIKLYVSTHVFKSFCRLWF